MKELPVKILLFVVASVISLFAIEYGLRWFSPTKDQFQFVYDPHPGFWHKSDLPGFTNSFGMPDKPRQIERQPGMLRVAVLGDSYMEWGGPTGTRMSDLLEQYSNGRLEVLNFGISSVGTVQELDIYRYHVRPFRPDVVICALLTANDIRNNHYDLEMSSGYYFLRYAVQARIEPNGQIKLIDAPTPTWPDRARLIFYQWFPSLYDHLILVGRSLKKIGTEASAAGLAEPQTTELTDSVLTQTRVSYQVYIPPMPGDQWDEAWQITEWSILQMRDEVEADGADFVLVILSDAIQLFDNPAEVFREKTAMDPAPSFDPFYPASRLARFCEVNKVTCINLAPLFKAYKEENNLAFPYFSYPDDDHWDTLGHKVAADIVYDFIRQRYPD